MSTTTEDIKARLSIVEIVGQYVKLQKAGAHWKANCPFHQEKTPSFMVNEEKQMWHCFGCGKGGDAFAFVMEMEGLDFREALKLLAERAGVDLPKYRGEGGGYRSEGGEKEEKDRSFEILELATKFYEKQLWESSGGKKILDYLHERGLSDESIRQFRLGFAPEGWRHMHDFLLKRGYATGEIERTSLIIRKSKSQDRPTTNSQQPTTADYYDRFRNRIMFPIADILGRVVGYSARMAPGGDESQAKYINTSETGVYHKSRALYGLHLAKQAIKEKATTILVEGNMDVIALHQAGFPHTVAVSGTALTPDQLSILKRYGGKLQLFFDMDAAGQAAAWKSADLAFGYEFSLEAVALPHGKDAADMGRDDLAGLKQAIATAMPAMGYFLDRLLATENDQTPEGKRRVVERSSTLLSAMKNEIERSHWVKELSRRLDLDERIVRVSVDQAMSARRRGTDLVPGTPTPVATPKTFGRRSETLRESLIGLMLSSTLAREYLAKRLTGETHEFMLGHPLMFFVQNATDDPVALIEDQKLQQEASRLVFQTLGLPGLVDAEREEREQSALVLAQSYLLDLDQELQGKDKLKTLAQAIKTAHERGDRDQEKALLQEFAARSRQQEPNLPSEP